MNENVLLDLECPYCGVTIKEWHEAGMRYQRWFVVECDTLEGGCGHKYVAGVSLWPDVVTRKIEGEVTYGSPD